MARPKTKTEEKTEVSIKQFKWSDSYGSLIVGFVVVVVALGILIAAFRGDKKTKDTSSIQDETQVEVEEKDELQTDEKGQKSYTVKAGDHLWKVAENFYKDGYKWVEIAKANNLQNPNLVFVGKKLIIPDIDIKEETIDKEPKDFQDADTPTPKAKNVKEDKKKNKEVKKDTITENTYTVVKGDHLWKIAVRSYGDGYKWVDIAKANKLGNPNIIHSGNVLKIPR